MGSPDGPGLAGSYEGVSGELLRRSGCAVGQGLGDGSGLMAGPINPLAQKRSSTLRSSVWVCRGAFFGTASEAE